MDCQILVIAEHNGSELDPSSADLISCASRIATERGWKTGVLVAGSELDRIVEGIRDTPVDAVYVADDAALHPYNSMIYAGVVASTLAQQMPRLILLAHSYFGIEISARIAAKLGATLWTNCTSVKCDSDALLIDRPLFRGAFVSTVRVEGEATCVVTLQRGSAPLHVRRAGAAPKVTRLPMPEAGLLADVEVQEDTKATFAEDITGADVLVAVGRGIGQESELAAYKDLAAALGGLIAATRPIVDAGWLTADHQVGLSGRTVRPKVYLACGISGAAQHTAGMRDSRLILAINEDGDAPIFQIAHYGVVGDVSKLVPELIKAAKARMQADRSPTHAGK